MGEFRSGQEKDLTRSCFVRSLSFISSSALRRLPRTVRRASVAVGQLQLPSQSQHIQKDIFMAKDFEEESEIAYYARAFLALFSFIYVSILLSTKTQRKNTRSGSRAGTVSTKTSQDSHQIVSLPPSIPPKQRNK